MFEDYQNQARKKPDEWFYPTVAFGVVTVVVITTFMLDFSGLISVSRWFSDGMKIRGELSVTASGESKVKPRSAKICLVPEDKIQEWVNIKNERAVIESQKAKLSLDYARYTKSRIDREADSDAVDADRRSRAESLQTAKSSQLEKAEADYRYWSSPAYYFGGLKDCAAQTATDAQGRFSLSGIKPGKYALAAEAGREVTNLKENYFWLIWVTPETVSDPVRLDDGNLMTANPPEKVVEIKDL